LRATPTPAKPRKSRQNPAFAEVKTVVYKMAKILAVGTGFELAVRFSVPLSREGDVVSAHCDKRTQCEMLKHVTPEGHTRAPARIRVAPVIALAGASVRIGEGHRDGECSCQNGAEHLPASRAVRHRNRSVLAKIIEDTAHTGFAGKGRCL
jgi:hypothetical protein